MKSIRLQDNMQPFQLNDIKDMFPKISRLVLLNFVALGLAALAQDQQRIANAQQLSDIERAFVPDVNSQESYQQEQEIGQLDMSDFIAELEEQSEMDDDDDVLKEFIQKIKDRQNGKHTTDIPTVADDEIPLLRVEDNVCIYTDIMLDMEECEEYFTPLLIRYRLGPYADLGING